MYNYFFTSEPHSYFNQETEIQSVTAVTRKYFKDFKGEYWSYYKALEAVMPDFKEKKPGRTPKMEWIFSQFENYPEIDFENEAYKIRKAWTDYGMQKALEGTDVHKEDEAIAFEEGKIRNPFNMKFYKTIKSFTWNNNKKYLIYNQLSDLEDGIYPELILPNKQNLYCGTSDRVFIETIGSTRYVDIIDRKNKTSVDKRNIEENALYPLLHLESCDFNRYSIAMSLYMNCLEEVGFTPRHMALQLKTKLEPVRYLKSDIVNICYDLQQVCEDILYK